MKKTIIITFLIVPLIGCTQKQEKKKQTYQNQIGDTPFDPDLDNSSFEFCDSNNVLHSRNYISYRGGYRILEQEYLSKYIFKPIYSSFNGYMVIRFAVNCKNETDRFRIQILDTDFSPTTCPLGLEDHILSIMKSLKGWKHPIYDGKDYDGYTFITLKFKNGQIEKI